MQKSFESIIISTGETLNSGDMAETPKRAADAFTYLTKGYEQSLDKIVNGALFDTDNDEMVIVKDIQFYSLCRHHLLPFFGKCHVGYLPAQKALGLSKIARIVDMYARRLQIQENLVYQIAQALQNTTNAKGVGVIIEAQHLCMKMRGVEKQDSLMTTSTMLGDFRSDSKTRQEFLMLIKS